MRQVLIDKMDGSHKHIVTSRDSVVTSREGSSRGTLQRYLSSCDDAK